MQDVADQSAAPTPIGADLCAIFVSLELSRSTWLATSLSSGRGEKMSKHSVSAGDIAALLARFSELRRKACTRRHPDLFPSSGSIAPYRRTFCFYGSCFGHRRHRHARIAGPRRQRRVRAGRNAPLAGWPCPTTGARSSRLRHDRGGDPCRSDAEFHPSRSSQGADALEPTTEILQIEGDEAKRRAVAKFIIRLAREDDSVNAAELRDKAVAAASPRGGVPDPALRPPFCCPAAVIALQQSLGHSG